MAKIKSKKRGRVFVDRKVQGALIIRLVAYWVAFLVSFIALSVLWSLFINPLRPMSEIIAEVQGRSGPALLASAWLLPVVLYDLVKLSNRFVGPVVRLKTALANLAKGQHVPPIHFRKGDFWIDLATQFNAVSARLPGVPSAAPAQTSRKPSTVEAVPADEISA